MPPLFLLVSCPWSTQLPASCSMLPHPAGWPCSSKVLPSDWSTCAPRVQNNLDCSRQAYDVFLANYPLCYGYWKKYADAEARLASPEAATAVFERGVVAVPYSVDLWGHYATHLASKGASDDVMAA